MRTKVFLVLAIVLMSSGMAGAQYTGALTLANVSVSPNPVVAGSNATITFRLYNSYGGFLSDVDLQAASRYPILNVSPAGSIIVGQVSSGLNYKYLTYTFAIPNTTPSGTYTIDFNATYMALGSEAAVATAVMPVSFYVQNRPVITVVASSPQPSALYSGYNQTIELYIENTGYGTARNVTVAVTSGDGLDILSSVSTFFISNLTAGSTAEEPLLVAAKGSGGSSLSASAMYYSSTLTRSFSSVQQINLSVAPSAEFNFTYVGGNLGIGSADVPVSYKITNTGTTTAQQLELTLETTYPVTPVAGTAYVGGLAAGASANVTFLVSIDSSGISGNYPVTIFEEWKQANGAANQQFTASSNFFVGVGSAASSTELIIAAIVAVVVMVLVIYKVSSRARRQAKKK